MNNDFFTHQKGDTYVVTGHTVDGRRFRITTDNPHHAVGINIWQGSLWQVRDGKRQLIKRVAQ